MPHQVQENNKCGEVLLSVQMDVLRFSYIGGVYMFVLCVICQVDTINTQEAYLVIISNRVTK